MSFIVAIDGPAGTGKGTVTNLLAQEFGLESIDTGAAYRCIALEMLNQGISINENDRIKTLLNNTNITINQTPQCINIFINEKDVTSAIRTKAVTEFVSPVSSIKFIRDFVTNLARKMAKGKNVIMEGRDITTVVFPEADIKIYLDAEPEIRALRRHLQNQKEGKDSSFEEVLASINKRDYNDKNKAFGALILAPDAIYIDTSYLTIEQVIAQIKELIINVKSKSTESFKF